MIDRPNGPTQAETEEIVGIIEGYMADLRSEKSLYINRCKPIHEAIKDTIEDAHKTKGFDKKALKVGVKQREFLRKMEELENELDSVTQQALDRLQAHLGTFADSPLGKAAMDAQRTAAASALKGKSKAKKRDPIEELVREDDQPPEEYMGHPVE
jgi:uncharacterized protein (UPF0335 family)